jgi:predicted neuraminidase
MMNYLKLDCHVPNAPRNDERIFKLIFTALCFLLILTLFLTQTKLSYVFKLDPENPSGASNKPVSFQEITLDNHQNYNHASSMVIDDKHKLLAWVGGGRELGPDINIYSAHIENTSDLKIKNISGLFDKSSVENDEKRYLHSLANPIIVKYNNQLWLFFVSTLGGWATSSINYKISSDEGLTWSSARVLTLSPFFNISHLLKGPPVFFEDGSLGLPIYSEFIDTGAKLLRLNTKGQVLSLQRLSSNCSSLQPIIVPMTPKVAYVFMRQKKNSDQKMFMNYTEDGGEHWNHFLVSPVANPDSAVAAVKADDNTILIAFNNTLGDRSDLSLAFLNTLKNSFCVIPFKKDSTKQLTYGYPYFIKYNDYYFLSYTSGNIRTKLNISLVKFNQPWLASQWKNCTPY